MTAEIADFSAAQTFEDTVIVELEAANTVEARRPVTIMGNLMTEVLRMKKVISKAQSDKG